MNNVIENFKIDRVNVCLGNIVVEGKQTLLSPEGPVIKCFVIHVLSNSKKETARKSFA